MFCKDEYIIPKSKNLEKKKNGLQAILVEVGNSDVHFVLGKNKASIDCWK